MSLYNLDIRSRLRTVIWSILEDEKIEIDPSDRLVLVGWRCGMTRGLHTLAPDWFLRKLSVPNVDCQLEIEPDLDYLRDLPLLTNSELEIIFSKGWLSYEGLPILFEAASLQPEHSIFAGAWERHLNTCPTDSSDGLIARTRITIDERAAQHRAWYEHARKSLQSCADPIAIFPDIFPENRTGVSLDAALRIVQSYALESAGFANAACVSLPLRLQGQFIGALTLASMRELNRQSLRDLTPSLLRVMRRISLYLYAVNLELSSSGVIRELKDFFTSRSPPKTCQTSASAPLDDGVKNKGGAQIVERFDLQHRMSVGARCPGFDLFDIKVRKLTQEEVVKRFEARSYDGMDGDGVAQSTSVACEGVEFFPSDGRVGVIHVVRQGEVAIELTVPKWDPHSGTLDIAAYPDDRRSGGNQENKEKQSTDLRSLGNDISQVLGPLAHSKAPVLIFGGTGTGKERIASRIHRRRASGMLIACNCAAAIHSILIADLLGCVARAFTDAKTARLGNLLLAMGASPQVSADPGSKDPTEHFIRYAGLVEKKGPDGSVYYEMEKPVRGTLFLDEIADLPLEGQGALLRVLNGDGFTPVGWDRPAVIRINPFIVGATRKEELLYDPMVFRQDLRARLDTWIVRTQRVASDDVPTCLLVAQTRLDELNDESGETWELSTDAILLLETMCRDGIFDGEKNGNFRGIRSAVDRARAYAVHEGPFCLGRFRRLHITATHLVAATSPYGTYTPAIAKFIEKIRHSAEHDDTHPERAVSSVPSATVHNTDDELCAKIDAPDVAEHWRVILDAVRDVYGPERHRSVRARLVEALEGNGVSERTSDGVLAWADPDKTDEPIEIERREKLLARVWAGMSSGERAALAFRIQKARGAKIAKRLNGSSSRKRRKQSSTR